MKLLLTFFVVMLFGTEAFCQKTLTGIVILANNDTVASEFKSPLNSLRYRPLNSTGKFIKITPEMVKEFSINRDSIVYESILPGRGLPDPIFLKRVEEGTMNLYEDDEAWTLNQASIIPGKMTFWYVSVPNKPLIEIKSGNFLFDSSRSSRRNSFAELIADAPEIVEQFKAEKSFSIETLRQYVQMYNIYKASTPVIGTPIK